MKRIEIEAVTGLGHPEEEELHAFLFEYREGKDGLMDEEVKSTQVLFTIPQLKAVAAHINNLIKEKTSE